MIKYSRSIVAFLDILSFGDLVRTQSPDEIMRIMRLAQQSSEASETDLEFAGRRSIYFSDTIILSCPIVGPYGPQSHGVVFDEILSIVHLQSDLIDRGSIFIRGALTIGDIYHDENVIFGPAVIDGHDIESKLCNYPRVVIDPKLLRDYMVDPLLRSQNNTAEEDLKYVKTLIRQDADGLWFIDYLSAILPELDNPEYYLEFIKKHKQLILQKSKANNKLNSIALKYNWLATYHNTIVNEMFERRVLSREHDSVFLITSKELETIHQF